MEGAAAEAAAHEAEENPEVGMEEARAVPAPIPNQPTAKEIETHNVAHTPYRAWCEACVRGRGRNADHKLLAAEGEHLVDTISVDYAFFGEQDLTAKPVLILREHRYRWTEALPVPAKGGGDAWVVKIVTDMVKRTGLRKFIFKSDQETSIVDLKKKVEAELGSNFEIIMEVSPVNEHESNGTIERAVQTVGGMIRTHKLALERAYGQTLGAGHAVVQWLIMHAAVMVSLFEIGSDGRTAYERTRGKRYRQELPIFGECV